jgi:predicted nucleic acid-binding protein
MPDRAEDRARDIQAELVARGQHRAVAISDVMVASVADVEGLTVLHNDGDFDIIAAITGLPNRVGCGTRDRLVRRVIPRPNV